MQNYFNYFTEIEEHFQQPPRLHPHALHPGLGPDRDLARRRHPSRSRPPRHRRRLRQARRQETRPPARPRKINGLAWAAQSVMAATEAAAEAATGTHIPKDRRQESGFETPTRSRLAPRTKRPGLIEPTDPATAQRLRDPRRRDPDVNPPALEDLDRTLTVLEEKLFATILRQRLLKMELVTALRAQADRELAPYRSKMQAGSNPPDPAAVPAKAPARSPPAFRKT